MCGIVGLWSTSINNNIDIVKDMMLSLRHRGPDSFGMESFDDGNLVLGHTRLSIRDVSSLGSQPMTSSCKNYCIVYNGEVYNEKHLHTKLKSINLNGSSDTELLLEHISKYGVESTLKILDGMFAFALFDLKLQCLYIARDFFGEKPLYYVDKDDLFLFSSELKGIVNSDLVDLTLSKQGVIDYFKYGYIRSPLTIYSQVKKLTQSSFLKITYQNDLKKFKYSAIESYINTNSVITSVGHNVEAEVDYDELHAKLKGIVRSRMASDVSLGCFLSGGIDSTLITAIMSSVSSEKLNTFTVGFEDSFYDESHYAEEIAAHFNTNHTTHIIKDSEVLEFVKNLTSVYDEPFSDPSQIPTAIISKIASDKVKVVLSGDGGDEAAMGYNRHVLIPRIYKISRFIPYFVRKTLFFIIKIFPPYFYDSLFLLLAKFRLVNSKYSVPGDNIYKFFWAFTGRTPMDIYNKLCQYSYAENILNDAYINDTQSSNDKFIDDLNIRRATSFYDLNNYLPDNILVKVDRASMLHSLEVRSPFLSRSLFNYIWSFADSSQFNNSGSKYMFRSILSRYMPSKLYERPKMGFGIPLDRYLRTCLKDWAEDLINWYKKNDYQMLNHASIDKLWAEHQSKKSNKSYQLWQILVFIGFLKASQSHSTL
jgi:asparagine synthase (glutamine-hydrolysing)